MIIAVTHRTYTKYMETRHNNEQLDELRRGTARRPISFCQLLHTCTKKIAFPKACIIGEMASDAEGHSRSSEMAIFDASLPMSGLW